MKCTEEENKTAAVGGERETRGGKERGLLEVEVGEINPDKHADGFLYVHCKKNSLNNLAAASNYGRHITKTEKLAPEYTQLMVF